VTYQIVMLTPLYPPVAGGAENQARNLAKELVKSNNVSIITSGIPNLPYKKIEDGIVVYRVPYIFKSLKTCILDSKWRWLQVINNILYVFFAFAFLMRIRLNNKNMILHLHGMDQSIFPAYIFKILFKVPIVVKNPMSFNDTTFKRIKHILFGKGNLVDKIKFKIMKNCDSIISFDEITKIRMNELGIEINKICIIQNGVDTEIFKLDNQYMHQRIKNIENKSARLLFVGRLKPQKNLPWLLSSFQKLLQDYPDIQLLIVGNGQEFDNLNKIIKDNKLQKNCKLFGESENILEIYKNTDILILPSIEEGIPNVILEAMSSEFPVISTDVGSISNIIDHGKNGLIIKAGDYDGLKKSIDMIFSDPDFARLLCQNARKTMIDNFSIQKIAKNYQLLYDQLFNIRNKLK